MEPRVGIATFVRSGTPRARGITAVYRMDPPLEGHEYVVVSAIDKSLQEGDPLAMLFELLDPIAAQLGIIPPVINGGDPKWETFIFACDEHGNTDDMQHLPGSVRGTMDHVLALQQAGYELKQPSPVTDQEINILAGKRVEEE